MAAAPAAPAAAPLESVWRAPLVPAALAVTAGILLDRHASVPLPVSLATAAACLLAWAFARTGTRSGLPLVYLALAGAAFGAAYHHYRHDVFAPDDIGNLAPAEQRAVQLRGWIDEEPFRLPAPPSDPLRSRDRGATTTLVLSASALRQGGDWVPVSGRLRVWVPGLLPDLHAGDEVEVVGQLARLPEPANPGEPDYGAYLRDQGIRARLTVRKTAEGVTRLARGWTGSWKGWLAAARGWGQGVLARTLPPRTQGVAMALLLGEGAPMRTEDWAKYVRTGVVHVLAISGQHLVVLALVLWWMLPRLNLRQRHAAWVVALVLLGYALLSGGRPPALRAAVVVCAACFALVLRRRVLPANLFALAWLVVALVNPMDLFSPGCLFSFLCVAVLYWGTRDWFDRERDPLDVLIEQNRPAWQRGLLWTGRRIFWAYVVTAVVWAAAAPLMAFHYHMISPVAILLGPVLTGLTSLALFTGFLLLLLAAVCWPLTAFVAPVLDGLIAACEYLVDMADRLPGSHFYLSDIPAWWVWAFYLGLLAALTQQPLRQRWRWALTAGLGWLCVGLVGGAARLPADELRCTFLAVGHGGCTVLELPDGRSLLYDAGAISGPELTRQHIAPFLWSRGIRRIDEVILSHADLDHFNGVRDLLDCFAVGQVTCTPTFAAKPTSAVQLTMQLLHDRRIPLRVVKAGDRLTAGDVTLDVLHPPAVGLEQESENARSLVLLVRHAGHTLLLTGDLEKEGMRMLLRSPRQRIDVLMAPHHGSRLANTPELARWARPRVVVACTGPPRGAVVRREPYTAAGIRYLGTWPHGAITVRSHTSGLTVETFVSGERFVVRGGAE